MRRVLLDGRHAMGAPGSLTAQRTRGHASCAAVAAIETSPVVSPSRLQHAQLTIFNSLTQRSEPLPLPANGDPLTWYACGPTVYDAAHIGHARTYVALDIIRRLLVHFSGAPVLYCMGVTDIDDKIVARANEQGVAPHALARRWEAAFFADMARLGTLPPTCITRVTEHVPEIIAYIQGIVAAGQGYKGADGVYFDVARMAGAYGKLMPSARHGDGGVDGPVHGESDEPARLERLKRDPRDFALWKLAKSAAEPAWPSPWGRGRPGWHIECSAMTHAVFGPRLDIHAGGIDLAFPHHCNEIAQCEAHNGGTPWARCFLHTGHVHIDGRKMSKSLKNFITVADVLSAGWSGDEFRVFCLAHRYRASVTYSEGGWRGLLVSAWGERGHL
jgi:cysteinyl-tRNA synthetase